MKLNNDFLTHTTENETLLVPVGEASFSGVVRGNKTLGALLELLKKETTEAELISALKARFDAPEGAIEADVQNALSKLREIGALDE